MKVKLNNVRLAFPALWEAKAAQPGQTPKFSAAFLLPNNHPQIAEIKKAMQEVAKEKWGAKAQTTYVALEKSDKLALHDGESKANYAGYSGSQFINAANPTRVPVFGADMTELSQAHGKPYAGCWVNAVIEIWAQDNQFGKRINATLMGVQFLRDDEPFSGGGVATADDFVAASTEPSTTDAVWGN